MPGRLIQPAAKLAILAVIEENKHVLFGRFGKRMNDGAAKTEAWKEVRLKAIEVKACTSDRDWVFVRDKLWGTWKSKALERKDNSKQTGAAGGRHWVLGAVDEKILEIVGTNSAAVIGLNVPQTGDKSSANIDSDSDTEFGLPAKRNSTPVHTRAAQLRTKRKLQIESLKLQKDALELQIYERRLRCLALERQMNVARSTHTQDLQLENEVEVLVLSPSEATEETVFNVGNVNDSSPTEDFYTSN